MTEVNQGSVRSLLVRVRPSKCASEVRLCSEVPAISGGRS